MLSIIEEKNIHGFTGDMKDFLRKGDYESALILIDDLKKYVLKLKKCQTHFNKNNLDASIVQTDFINSKEY